MTADMAATKPTQMEIGVVLMSATERTSSFVVWLCTVLATVLLPLLASSGP